MPSVRPWLVILLAAVLTAGLAASSQDKPQEAKKDIVDITGKWDMSIETGQGPMSVQATFKVEGDKVSGAIAGPQGEVPITGTISETELSFWLTVDTSNGQLTVTFTGKPGKDKLEGTADFGGRGSGAWSATRAKS